MPNDDCRADWIDDNQALSLLGENHCAGASWRQYPAYAAEAAQRVRARSRYVVVHRGSRAIAMANLRTRAIPLLGATTLISHGPVLLAGHSDERAAALPAALDALRRFAGANGLGELRVDPDPRWSSAIATACPSGFRRSDYAGAYRTIVLDLTGDAKAIRKRMDGKWRRDLQRGEQEGLTVSRSANPADFLKLEPLLAELSQTKGFGVAQDCAFFARCAAASLPPERFFVHLVSRHGELLSGHIGAFSGTMAVYLLGATSGAGRALRASYTAQWAAIETARELGMTSYDLGGIDPDANPDVYRFKKRMGGVELVGQNELCALAPGWRGALMPRARALYQVLRR